MGDFFVFCAAEPDECKDFADLTCRTVPTGLHNAQIFLTGQVAVVGGGFNQRPDILQQLDTVAFGSGLAKNGDFPTCRVREP